MVDAPEVDHVGGHLSQLVEAVGRIAGHQMATRLGGVTEEVVEADHRDVVGHLREGVIAQRRLHRPERHQLRSQATRKPRMP